MSITMITKECYYIYLTTNFINGKNYVGKHFGKLNDIYKGSGPLIKKAFAKYGKDNFYKLILYTCDSAEEANRKEKEFINYYRSLGKAEYNIADGGEGGFLGKEWYKNVWDACHNEKYSNKISKSLLGHDVSEEQKIKISKTLKQGFSEGRIKRNDWTKGKHWYNNGVIRVVADKCPEGFVPGKMVRNIVSEETRLKMSNKRKGRKLSEETKEKMRKVAKLREPPTEEQRNQISKTLKERYSKEHRYWYNNGKINILTSEECPNGFVPGRLLKPESKEKIMMSLNRGKSKK